MFKPDPASTAEQRQLEALEEIATQAAPIALSLEKIATILEQFQRSHQLSTSDARLPL